MSNLIFTDKLVYRVLSTLYIKGNFVNIEDSHKMSQNATFHQSLYCVIRKNNPRVLSISYFELRHVISNNVAF